MKKTIVLSVLIFAALYIYAQSPQSFSYQAVVRDGAGVVIPNQLVSFRISIQQSTAFTDVYVETQQETTNDFGLVNLQIGTGTVVSGVFADIDWASDLTFIQIEMDETGGTSYQTMGLSQMLSVPYALYANKAGSSDSTIWKINGNDIYYNKGNVGIGLNAPTSKLVVKSDSTANIDDVIFSVLNAQGDTVLAVYQEGVRIWVSDDDTSGAKAAGNRGGFAVGGFSPSKSTTNEYLRVTPDSVRVYIEESGGTKASGNRGGFAVGGFSPSKTLTDYYFNIEHITDAETINPSEPRFLWYPEKESVLAGRVIIEHADSVGLNSVAIGYETKSPGDWSQALGYKPVARGDYSTAIGNKSIAKGNNSVAIGDSAVANGNGSFSFGYKAEAIGEGSIAFGSAEIDQLGLYTGAYTKAFGDYSFAAGLGAQTTPGGFGSVAIGVGTRSENYGAASVGYYNRATGVMSYVLGASSHAGGENSMAIGVSDTASAYNSFAMGVHCNASAQNTMAIGNNARASGLFSSAIGNLARANADYSFAIGQAVSTNSKTGAIIIGDGSTFSSTYCTANNQFMVRAVGGYVFYSNPILSNETSVFISQLTGDMGLGIAAPARKLHVKDVMRLEPRALPPFPASAGDMYYSSTDNKLKVYNGTMWMDCY